MVLDRSAATASVANADVLREVEASDNELLEAREGPPTDAQRRLDRGYQAALELTRQLVGDSGKKAAALEGIHCVESAQAGLTPLSMVARQLGMGWHVLADGDNAGKHYIQPAQAHLRGAEPRRHLTRLPQRDVETCSWFNGYAELFCRAAGVRGHVPHKAARGVIEHAIRKHSKPGLALLLLDEVNARGPQGVPAPLRHVIEACVQQARRQVEGAPSPGAAKPPRRPRKRRRP